MHGWSQWRHGKMERGSWQLFRYMCMIFKETCFNRWWTRGDIISLPWQSEEVLGAFKCSKSDYLISGCLHTNTVSAWRTYSLKILQHLASDWHPSVHHYFQKLLRSHEHLFMPKEISTHLGQPNLTIWLNFQSYSDAWKPQREFSFNWPSGCREVVHNCW